MSKETSKQQGLSYLDVFNNAPVGILVFHKEWKIISANKSFVNLYESKNEIPERVVGKDIFEVTLFFETNLQNDIQSLLIGKQFEKKVEFNKLSYLVKGSPIFIDGEFSGGIITIEEITGYNTPAQSDDNQFIDLTKFDKIPSSIFDAVIGFDEEGKVVLWNDSAERTFGYSIEEVYDSFLGNIFNNFTEEYLRMVKADLIVNSSRSDEYKITKDNITKVFDVKIFRINDRGNESFIMLCTAVTNTVSKSSFLPEIITEEKENLPLPKANLEDLFEDTDYTLWISEKVNGQLKPVLCSSSILKITGYSNEEFFANPFLWFRIIHPDDVENVLMKFRMLHINHSLDYEEVDYRIINRVGNIVWVLNKIKVDRGNSGDIEKLTGVLRDISREQEAEEKLIKLEEDSIKLAATRDRILSIISHDLRAPFSSIIGASDILLKNKAAFDDKSFEYIQSINDSAKSFLTLVNGLLDWVKLQTKQAKFEPEIINLRDVILKSIKMMSIAASQKSILLKYENEADIFAFADANLVLPMLNHVLSNALKYTNDSGKVTVKVTEKRGEGIVEICVKDTGIGIEEEDFSKLFNVDVKFSKSGTRGEMGFGLGLPIVKDIINRHNGKIIINSEPGRGTEVLLTLPCFSNKVLIVDDNKTERDASVKIFKSILPGFAVETAEDGRTAYELMRKFYPAVVFINYDTPVINSLNFYKELSKMNSSYRPLYIVAGNNLSADLKDEHKILGVENFIPKPINLFLLRNILNKIKI